MILDEIGEYLSGLSAEVRGKISGDLESLEKGETETLLIKQFRIIFFRLEGSIYVIDVFKKQSKKTPLRIIERAEKIYRKIIELS